MLVSDGTQNVVYRLDLTGHVFAMYAVPSTQTRGVAYDRRARNGFWVTGLGDRSLVYKVQWTGGIDKVSLMTPLNDVRGLDYYVEANGLDLLVEMGVNVNNVEVFNTWRVSDGSMQMSSGQVLNGVFQSGYWGVRALGPPPAMDDHFDRWISRNNGTLDRWLASSTRTTALMTTFGAIRGLDVAKDGTFWLVAGTKIIHANGQGAFLDSFAAPSGDAMGLSLQE
jgi:hypothetical protein